MFDINKISKLVKIHKHLIIASILNIALQPDFGLKLCKIKISCISNDDILCGIMPSQIIKEMYMLIKKKYKLAKGAFIFNNEELKNN